jgi:hypothetical protein
VTIPAGATSAAITVANVQASGAGKTVIITLEPSAATPPAYILSSNVTATTTLFNTATIAMTVAATSTINGVFTVSLTGPAPTTTTVNLTFGGTAIVGTDYAPISSTVAIAAGATSAPVLVTGANNSGHTLTVNLAADTLAPATYYVGTPASASMILGINNVAPVITSAATANATVGTAFSYQITAQNSPTSFAASNLPNGVTINTTTGLISGTPTLAGSTTVGLSATNAYGTGTQTLFITITGGGSTTSSGGTTGLPVSSGGGGKGGCGLGGGALGLVFGWLALSRRRRKAGAA